MVKLFGLPTQDSFTFVDFQTMKNYLTAETGLQLPSMADSAQFITNYSHQNPLYELPPDSSFKDLVSALTKYHRVAIGDGTIVNYVSQSEVVKLLTERGVFSHIGSKTREELHLGSKDVISVKDNQKVIEAFILMVTHKVSGVAVIDDKGQLVGQISASDIKNITNTGEMISRLYDTYHPFRKILEENFKVPKKTITVPASATLYEVLETLVKNKLHRVYVLGNDHQAVGVITLTDILKLVCLD